MTVKQKFDKIDQSKLLQAQVDILKSMQAKTDNFKTKDKEALEKIEMGLDKIIAKLQESNPDALKSTAKKTATAKTATKGIKGRKTAMQLAKEIRKPNESWNEAVKRAGSMMRGDAKQASKVVTSELQKLKSFINRRKQLKGIAGTDLLRDSKRQAKPRGQRTSKDGNVYYEYRENRIDRLAPNYPKNAPLLADGGGVDGIEEDIDMTDDYVLRVNKGVEPKDRASMREFIAKTNESREAMTYELGGDLEDEDDEMYSYQDYYRRQGGRKFKTEEEVKMFIKLGKPFVRKLLREGKLVVVFNGKEFYIAEKIKYDDYELGGAFMTSDLAGNTGGGTLGLSPNMPLSGVSGTHYTGLVGETGALSSGEMFAHGGGVGNKEKLLKELYKLQRELNSSRLQTYILGDTSDEEMARQRERASKLERFNEVLKELNEYAGGGNLSRDRKYVNYREDYEIRYSKGKGRHGYGNLKFANGGAMMANQQVIDDASQHYVNYYLNDGASAGMFKDGGAIKNQYAGRTSENVWNNLSRGQRSHFLYDHMDEIQEYKDIDRLSTSQIRVAINSDWMSLDKDIKNRFSNHVREGQYATGGMMPKPSTSKHRNE
jgi:hypothetical protein